MTLVPEMLPAVQLAALGGVAGGRRRPAIRGQAVAAVFDPERLDAYRAVLDRYVELLAEGGITAVPTRVQGNESADGQLVGWLVQPMLPSGSLITHRLRDCNDAEAVSLFDRVAERVASVISPTMGLDSQLSNWAVVDDQLDYLDRRLGR